MKTVQQVLWELDIERLINAVLARNPIEYDIEGEYLDRTVRSLRDSYMNNLRRFIHQLRETSIELPKDEQKGILYVFRELDNVFRSEAFGLVYLNELIEKGTSCQDCKYDFSERSELLGFMIAETPLTQKHIYELVADVIGTASFFGYEQEQIKERKAEIIHLMNEGKRIVAPLSPEDEDPIEKSLRYAAIEAEIAYRKQTRNNELTRIRDAYLSEQEGKNHD